MGFSDNSSMEIENYTIGELESFVNAFKKASDIIRSENPDYVVAPMIGAIPFIDILNVVDRKFDNDRVEYMPASSRFANLDGVMHTWLLNFLRKNYHGNDLKLLSIDEVVSGSSAVRGYNQLEDALTGLADERVKGLESEDVVRDSQRMKDYLKKKIKYKVIGIVEPRSNKAPNKTYSKLVRKGVVKPLNVERIITMDDNDFCPLQLEVDRKTEEGRLLYKPEIKSVNYSTKYINLLKDIATLIGADPEKINPVNVGKLSEFAKYLGS